MHARIRLQVEARRKTGGSWVAGGTESVEEKIDYSNNNNNRPNDVVVDDADPDQQLIRKRRQGRRVLEGYKGAVEKMFLLCRVSSEVYNQ